MKNLIFFIRWLCDRILIGCKKLRFSSPAVLCCMLLSLSFSGFAVGFDDNTLEQTITPTVYTYITGSFYVWEDSLSKYKYYTYFYINVGESYKISYYPGDVPDITVCPNTVNCKKITCSMCNTTYCSSHNSVHVCSGGSGSSTGDSSSGSSTGDSGSGSSTGDSGSGSSTADTSSSSDIEAASNDGVKILGDILTSFNEAKDWIKYNMNYNDMTRQRLAEMKTNQESMITQLQNNQQTMGQIYTNLHADNENTNNKLDDLKDKSDTANNYLSGLNLKSDTANNYLSGLNSKADIRNQGISDLKDGVGNIKDTVDTIQGINDNIRSGVTNVDGTVKELMDKVDPSTANPVTLKENLTSDKLKNKSNALDSIKKKIMPPSSFYNVSSSSSFWDKTITLNLSSFGVDDMDLSIKGGYYYRNSVLSTLATFTRALSTVVFAFFFVRGIITALRQW